ncbi:phosphotransferase [Microbacterium sp. 5K110]|jgi:trehalose synthase-fused probable maltokinase|uniref:maltokinase N-terminal cap-like domain-containing protein n=1 Tax=unclassified Microbacterium TaxID=2609290 RepID=UPI0010FD0701|nr:phosphotransferase [Microbacterium sp. 5K110]TLF26919.1 aminoglycoside phosphotransferase [Microbacterium sp. 5K110]
MGDLLDLLAVWMPRQRWYGTKGRDPQLTLVAEWKLDAAASRLLLVRDDAATPPVVYQVPVSRRDPEGVLPGSLIGPADEGRVWSDATTDGAFTDLLFGLVSSAGSDALAPEGLVGIPLATPSTVPEVSVPARVLSGEQSNTSIIFRPEGGRPVICKLFRQVNAGINPDVELQSALASGGATFVPAAIGELRGTWTATNGESVTGSLAFAQEFFDGVEDAWRVALQAALAGDDFTASARALGESVAGMHVALAAEFPTVAPDAVVRSTIAAAWERRLTIALAEVPALTPYAERIRAVYSAAAAAEWPPLQRVHGDLHLGQVLHTPTNGWVLLDFEGEPLRPITERRSPDLAVRDVAGMLRSFDYVSGAVAEDDGAAVRAWVIAAQEAFLDGYAATVGTGPAAPDTLLAAFELDKAVYEAIYETRNRPDWIGIPLAAIGRLAPLER